MTREQQLEAALKAIRDYYLEHPEDKALASTMCGMAEEALQGQPGCEP